MSMLLFTILPEPPPIDLEVVRWIVAIVVGWRLGDIIWLLMPRKDRIGNRESKNDRQTD